LVGLNICESTIVMRRADTIRILNQLILAGRDGEDFCEHAQVAAEPALAVLLRQRGEEWGRLSDELQALVLLLGGLPARAATLAARALHLWLAARARILGADDALVLENWERLERASLARYEQSLAGDLPERIRRTLSLQCDRVLARLEQVSRLRDQYIVQSVAG